MVIVRSGVIATGPQPTESHSDMQCALAIQEWKNFFLAGPDTSHKAVYDYV